MSPKILLTLFISFGFLCNTHAKESKKPNIIFFLVDDMGWQETSVPFHTKRTKLNDRFVTPNMEKLASEGMKFTQAYASAICSPTRVSLMTGASAARHRVSCWTLHKNKSSASNHPTLKNPDWNVNGLVSKKGEEKSFASNTTLPMQLQKAGYHTIHAGKAHFGAFDTSGENPSDLGFDVNIAGSAIGGPGSYHGDKNFSGKWRGAPAHWDVPGLEKYHGQKINLTEAITREAILAMDNAVKKEKKPFYLYMSHYSVHAPWEADRRYVDKYKKQGLKGLKALQASMIEGMDKSLGDIMNKLKELKVDKNTIVVFMSDNGAPMQMDRNWPLRGHKFSPYEAGGRIPMIVKWPKKVKKASQCDTPVIIEDIYPTFLRMAKAKKYIPKKNIDGKSFIPLLKGKTPKSTRNMIWHYPTYYIVHPYSSIRRGDWKLIFRYHNQSVELYNLKDDLSEDHNLARKNPKKAQELRLLLRKELIARNAQYPSSKKTGKVIQP